MATTPAAGAAASAAAGASSIPAPFNLMAQASKDNAAERMRVAKERAERAKGGVAPAAKAPRKSLVASGKRVTRRDKATDTPPQTPSRQSLRTAAARATPGPTTRAAAGKTPAFVTVVRGGAKGKRAVPEEPAPGNAKRSKPAAAAAATAAVETGDDGDDVEDGKETDDEKEEDDGGGGEEKKAESDSDGPVSSGDEEEEEEKQQRGADIAPVSPNAASGAKAPQAATASAPSGMQLRPKPAVAPPKEITRAPDGFMAAALRSAAAAEPWPDAYAKALAAQRPMDTGPVYFERQVLKHCIKHAVNNLVGHELLTVPYLDNLARQLAKSKDERLFDEYDGAYVWRVIHAALRKAGYDAQRVGKDVPFTAIHAQPSGKFLVIVTYGLDAREAEARGIGAHALGVDCDRQLLLDSQDDAPVPLTEAAFALRTRPNDAFPRTRIAHAYRIVAQRHQPRVAAAEPADREFVAWRKANPFTPAHVWVHEGGDT